MAQVTVKINGYAHTVICEDGQEGHLQAMAAQVDDRISSIKALGQSGEARLLVLAALLMADELHDLHVEMAALRERAAPAPSAAVPVIDHGAQLRLSRLADRAEAIASELERS